TGTEVFHYLRRGPRCPARHGVYPLLATNEEGRIAPRRLSDEQHVDPSNIDVAYVRYLDGVRVERLAGVSISSRTHGGSAAQKRPVRSSSGVVASPGMGVQAIGCWRCRRRWLRGIADGARREGLRRSPQRTILRCERQHGDHDLALPATPAASAAAELHRQ